MGWRGWGACWGPVFRGDAVPASFDLPACGLRRAEEPTHGPPVSTKRAGSTRTPASTRRAGSAGTPACTSRTHLFQPNECEPRSAGSESGGALLPRTGSSAQQLPAVSACPARDAARDRWGTRPPSPSRGACSAAEALQMRGPDPRKCMLKSSAYIYAGRSGPRTCSSTLVAPSSPAIVLV